MTCIKCGKPVSQKEMDERYKELIDKGITPMIVVMCKECRENKLIKHWMNWR